MPVDRRHEDAMEMVRYRERGIATPVHVRSKRDRFRSDRSRYKGGGSHR